MLESNAITFVRESSLEKEYRVNGEASAAEIAQFLTLLPRGLELTFHDRYYPSISDPGAFVSVRRKGNIYSYRLANHGWSSDWMIQSVELLSAYILTNARSRSGDEPPLGLTIRKVSHGASLEGEKQSF